MGGRRWCGRRAAPALRGPRSARRWAPASRRRGNRTTGGSRTRCASTSAPGTKDWTRARPTPPAAWRVAAPTDPRLPGRGSHRETRPNHPPESRQRPPRPPAPAQQRQARADVGRILQQAHWRRPRWSVAARGRAAGVAAVLRPRAGVEPAGAQAGMLEREQVVTGRNARPAVRDHGRTLCDTYRREPLAQLGHRQEPAARVHVLPAGQVACARDVSRPRVDRLDVAAEPGPVTRVEHHGGPAGGVLDVGDAVRRPRPRREGRPRAVWIDALELAVVRDEATVEQGRVVTGGP